MHPDLVGYAIVRTPGFWLTAIAVVLIGVLGGGAAFVATQDEPAYLLAVLLGVAVVAVAAGGILLALGKARPIAWGLLGGVALMAALALVLFVLGLLVLLVLVGVWIFQAGRQP